MTRRVIVTVTLNADDIPIWAGDGGRIERRAWTVVHDACTTAGLHPVAVEARKDRRWDTP